MAKYRLGDIAPVSQGRVADNDQYWLLNLDVVESNTGKVLEYVYVDYSQIGASTVSFDQTNVLYSKLRPYLNKVVIPDRAGYATSEMLPLKPNEQVITRKYLTYFLRSPHFVEYINGKTSGAKMPRANIADLKSIEIECPPIMDQNRITSQFDLIATIIDNRKKELAAFDDLIKARFVELFETKQDNYDECHLEDVADIVSGITKGRKTKCTQLREVPYMAVSNVKDGYIDWTTVKTILATEDEIEQYRLLANDVLMTEGGDPDKVGRGSIISDPPEDCIHQNHIFRVRLDETRLLPRYFATFLQSPVAKMYFLRAAKQTTGIASINMKQLRGLPTILPPLNKQREFVLFCQQVDKSKFEVQRSLEEAQKLFDSLMQEYFS